MFIIYNNNNDNNNLILRADGTGQEYIYESVWITRSKFFCH